MSIEAKNIREDIARSRAAAQKNDLVRTLEHLRDAVYGTVNAKVFGRERFEVEALTVEAIKDLNQLKTMKKVMPKGLTYRKGKERELYTTLKRLHSKLKQAIEAARVRKLRQSMAQLDVMLGQAGKHMKAKEEMEARKLYRKAADTFTEIPGLLSDIGTRMVMGGLVSEAVEYLSRSLEINSRDARAHQSLIMCYEGLGELPKAEDAVNNAIKYLGASEPLYLKLGALAVAQTKWDVAMDAAERVLKNNPLSKDAKKIAAKAKPKVYRSTSGTKAGSAQPGAAAKGASLKGGGKSVAKKKKAAGEIKLDF